MTRLPEQIDPELASDLLDSWGFLADPALPHRPGPAFLLVAIRARPTLSHYDPEVAEYWITDELGHGVRETLSYASRIAARDRVLVGAHLRGRPPGVTNSYLTFGGTLHAARVADDVICVFSSPAPLLRRGGHSQGWDTGAHNVGGFFGRFRAAAGYAFAFERLAAKTDPTTRYPAFVCEFVSRYRGSEYLRDHYPKLWTLMLAEEHRLRHDEPRAWGLGVKLLAATRQVAAGQVLTESATAAS